MIPQDVKNYKADAFQVIPADVAGWIVGIGCFVILAFFALPDLFSWAQTMKECR
jgi:hypothetical protein